MNEQKIEKLLRSMPKARIPLFDLGRVRNQVLDRIAIQTEQITWITKVSAYAPFLKVGAGVMASLFIVISLTLGTAVAALDSVPGSAIYPLKKVVENIQLRLTPNDQKANLQLKFAGNRMNELEQVLEQKEEGKISEQEAEEIIAHTMQDLQKTTAAAVSSTKNPPSTNVVNKLTVISNKLQAASVQSEGQVKIELEKAIEATKITQEEAIKNIENAGLIVENSPIIENSVTASGKLTVVALDSVSIGTAKFLLTADTKYTGVTLKDLKAGQAVDILGEIQDNKSYALEIKLVAETKEIKTETIDPEVSEETPKE